MKKEIIEKKIQLYKEKRKQILENNEIIRNVKFHKNIHPILSSILSIKRTILGQTINVISDKSNIEKDKPVIYAVTHIGKYDYEMVSETLKSYFYTLSGDWNLMYGTIDDYYFRLSGVIYVDTEDKEDRRNSFEYNVKALKQGISLLWFPEGIWNLSDNLPMLNLYPGVIKAAEAANVEIVPIAVDQRNKNFYINIGKNINVNELNSNKLKQLRDTMATLKWEIWEQFEIEKRSEIPDDYYEKFLRDRLNEWPQFNMQIIKNREFKEKNIVNKNEVFNFMNNILNINDNNIFLFMDEKQYIKKYCGRRK